LNGLSGVHPHRNPESGDSIPISCGGLSASGKGQGQPARRDLRLPKKGDVLCRSYKGREIAVRVLESGVEYEGRRFRSLSAIAQAVTGKLLPLDEPALIRARQELIRARLIAYERPLYQVLSLDEPVPRLGQSQNLGEIFRRMKLPT